MSDHFVGQTFGALGSLAFFTGFLAAFSTPPLAVLASALSESLGAMAGDEYS